MENNSPLPMAAQTSWRVIGVDPGFASMGVAILEHGYPSGRLVVRSAKVLESKKADKKTLQAIRVADDDSRRMLGFWDELLTVIRSSGAVAMGLEQWRPFPGQMGGNAWKVGAAAQMAQCAGWACGIRPVWFLPSDLKRRFLGQQAGDKNRIGYAILQHVDGLAELMASVARGKHEHIYDAVGLAVLALEEMYRVRQMAGLT